MKKQKSKDIFYCVTCGEETTNQVKMRVKYAHSNNWQEVWKRQCLRCEMKERQ